MSDGQGDGGAGAAGDGGAGATGAGDGGAGAVAGAIAGQNGDGGAGAGAGAGGAAGATGGDGGTPPAIPSWMEGFSDDLRGDPDLTRYATPEAAAKALKETRAWARGRVALPKEGDDASWNEFVGKVRPATAEEYTLPDGVDAATAEAFKPLAHTIGLHPKQAAALAEFDVQRMKDAQSAIRQQGETELQAIELELGASAYNQRLEATEAMLRNAGIEIGDIADGLSQTLGAEKTMRALFKLAEMTGELSKVDGVATDLRMGSMSPESAQAELDRQNSDSAFLAKAKVEGSPEHARRKALIAAAARARP